MRRFFIFSSILIAAALVISSCGQSFTSSDAGGKLPTAVSAWSEENGGDGWPALTPEPTPAEDALFKAADPPEAVPGRLSVGDDKPVTRAEAAKMLALARFSMEEINAMQYKNPFNDVQKEAWYAKYVNAVYADGRMLGYNNQFMPDGYITYGHMYELLSPDIAEPTDANRDTAVSYALWVDLYMKALEEAGGGKIKAVNAVVMGFYNEASAQLVTDIGAFSCEGKNLSAYVDRELRLLHRDGEVVAVAAVVSDAPTIKNAFVLNADQYGATLFSGGGRRYYYFGKDCPALPVGTTVGDFTVYQGEILDAVTTNSKITGTILRTGDAFIELKEYGLLPADAHFKIYALTGEGASVMSFKDLLPGTRIADFYVKNNALCAGVITVGVSPETIRVALNTSGFTGLVHESVSITCDVPFTVTAGSVRKEYAAGHPFNVNAVENSDLFGQSRLYIESGEPDGRFAIGTIKRASSVTYRGTFEIAAETGGWTIVNELPLEEYLYAVVPSEMPASYGLEAAMVQAVTARSYAYNQFYENRFHAYGAHVDDSVSSQVYNNIPETELSVEAVNKTAGQCLTWLGRVISANFYSTSSGVTASSGEVWPAGGAKFPGETPPYLRSQPLLVNGKKPGDLSKDSNVRRFIKDTSVAAYDSGFSWFRWNVEMTAEELAASINANLPGRAAAAPELIITEKGDASDGIGELIKLEVLKRGEGGNVMELRITGTLATLRVLTEYNVRVLLSPRRYIPDGRDIVIYRGDGTYVTNYSPMPSAFFVIEDGYKFYGGGNGHGVGMSQNAVKGMADLGFKFNEILEKFYPGTEVAVIT